ncbi:hypothetical protein F2Q69_00061482 [Brassica cretica]|uniref:Uncharacterized protein n=1 Tax=Brassica cretica TaxID=69181 RepID=A0A8S9RCN6_BRACR|nr:hypothetical protein F2Q69_00061482 [Brassica cretica]
MYLRLQLAPLSYPKREGSLLTSSRTLETNLDFRSLFATDLSHPSGEEPFKKLSEKRSLSQQKPNRQDGETSNIRRKREMLTIKNRGPKNRVFQSPGVR